MYQQFIFKPLYNILVLIMDVPWIDIGIAVILFTVVVRFVLYPLSKSALITQIKMKEVEPELSKIRAQYANDRAVQAQKMMELYKLNGIKPFSGVLLMIIQLPILFALIQVFYKVIPTVKADLLYSFVPVPEISHTFLGIDMTERSLILALIVAVAQFFQLKYSLASIQAKTNTDKGVQPGDKMTAMANSMTTQMKYVMPLIAFASVYWLIPSQFPEAASVIAIYWTVTSLFTLAQELYIRKQYAKRLAKI